jgi:beta-galactosidase
VNLKKDYHVAILTSIDSANALSYMPVSDKVGYMTVLNQMYNALYDLNVEPDFVSAGSMIPSRYRVLLVPPLYSASNSALQAISDYVKTGGHVVMSFKSGFTNEYSTVRDARAPGPLRAAAGFHYQEFSNLSEPVRLSPDPYHVEKENQASVWAEFLIPETAEAVMSFDHLYWRFPAVTRNRFGSGTLTYEGTVLTDALQREIVKEVLSRAELTGADQELPAAVKVRHGRNAGGTLLHYYFNFSGHEQRFAYPYSGGSDLLSGRRADRGQRITLGPWDLAIIAEQ